MVRIRLRRMGRKNAPFYRIVIAESTDARDGDFIEIIGTYNPHAAVDKITVERERAAYWISQGAQPSETVRSLLRKAGIPTRK